MVCMLLSYHHGISRITATLPANVLLHFSDTLAAAPTDNSYTDALYTACVTITSIPASYDVGTPLSPPTPSAPIYSIFPSLRRSFHPLSVQVCVCLWLKRGSAICKVPVSLIPAEWIWLCASHTGDERGGWRGRGEPGKQAGQQGMREDCVIKTQRGGGGGGEGCTHTGRLSAGVTLKFRSLIIKRKILSRCIWARGGVLARLPMKVTYCTTWFCFFLWATLRILLCFHCKVEKPMKGQSPAGWWPLASPRTTNVWPLSSLWHIMCHIFLFSVIISLLFSVSQPALSCFAGRRHQDLFHLTVVKTKI